MPAEDGDAPTTVVQPPETAEAPKATEEAVTSVDEVPQTDPIKDDGASEDVATDAPTDPLRDRLEILTALRARTLAALPRIRALQNADHAAPAALAAARERIEAWNADWRDALGLAGKRPKKVRPDVERLTESRNALVGHLSSAERTVAAAQSRLTEVSADGAARVPAAPETL